ncbi:MAG: zinc-binding dehydrogenase [Christensenellales bacterium]|jgi:threonine dehydrogenase-like Zn-dependent dehydrogenase
MSECVKAAVMKAPGVIEIERFPKPKPAKGAAVCKVVAAGVCGTDKHTYKGETAQYVGTAAETHGTFPLIQGHENVLIIEEIDQTGSENLDFNGNILKPGDRVTMCPDVRCQTCHVCKHLAVYSWCPNMRFNYGNTRSCDIYPHLFGGFAEYIYIEPGTTLYKVPDGLSDEMASLTELMCVAYTLDKAKEFYSFSGEGFGFNDTIVIQGMGPLGLIHLIKARMMGAGKIIVTDISDYKLNIAKQFGADITLNVHETTAEERLELIRQETDGLGADMVIECVGRPEVIPEGLDMVRVAGLYIEPGNFVDCGPIPISPHLICSKSIRIMGMSNHSFTGYKPSMEMMLRYKDAFPWEKFVSHVFPLDEAEQAIRTSMQPESMKVLIKPWL